MRWISACLALFAASMAGEIAADTTTAIHDWKARIREERDGESIKLQRGLGCSVGSTGATFRRSIRKLELDQHIDFAITLGNQIAPEGSNLRVRIDGRTYELGRIGPAMVGSFAPCRNYVTAVGARVDRETFLAAASSMGKPQLLIDDRPVKFFSAGDWRGIQYFASLVKRWTGPDEGGP
jgi:hypothetical protein